MTPVALWREGLWAYGLMGMWACGTVRVRACGPADLWRRMKIDQWHVYGHVYRHARRPVGLWAYGPVGL